MKILLILGVAVAGVGLLLLLFQLFQRSKAIAAKVPTNFLITILVFGLLGLTGFTIAKSGGGLPYPLLVVCLVMLAALILGTSFTDRLYNKWEWSKSAAVWRKLLYLLGISLTGAIAFWGVFILSSNRGWSFPDADHIVWAILPLSLLVFLPICLSIAFEYWNAIPRLSQVRHYFQLPVSQAPPFIETGGHTIQFHFVIALDYRSKEIVKSKVAVPLAKSIQEAFHYKLHEHNIVKRYAKKIVIAENKRRDRLYAWYFYRKRKVWWNLWEKKIYLDPTMRVSTQIGNGETVFVERFKTWEQQN